MFSCQFVDMKFCFLYLQDFPPDVRGTQPAHCQLRALYGPWDASASRWQAECVREGRQDSICTALHDIRPEDLQLRQQDLWELWGWWVFICSFVPLFCFRFLLVAVWLIHNYVQLFIIMFYFSEPFKPLEWLKHERTETTEADRSRLPTPSISGSSSGTPSLVFDFPSVSRTPSVSSAPSEASTSTAMAPVGQSHSSEEEIS